MYIILIYISTIYYQILLMKSVFLHHCYPNNMMCIIIDLFPDTAPTAIYSYFHHPWAFLEQTDRQTDTTDRPTAVRQCAVKWSVHQSVSQSVSHCDSKNAAPRHATPCPCPCPCPCSCSCVNEWTGVAFVLSNCARAITSSPPASVSVWV